MTEEFKIDNCGYCACLTHFSAKSIAEALSMVEDGEIGCENCGVSEHNDFDVYWKNYCNGNWEIIKKHTFKRELKKEKKLR